MLVAITMPSGADSASLASSPTWAPMLAFNVSADNTWRGSRLPEQCSSKEDIQGGHPQQGVGKIKTYGCYYSNARLLYTATLVKKP